MEQPQQQQQSAGEKFDDYDSEIKYVCFSTADIYVFHMTLGDNPSVLKGPPVQIAWKPVHVFRGVNLDKARSSKEKGVGPVRRFSRSKRIEILREEGLEINDIKNAEKMAMIARNERKETIWNMKRQHQQERWENVKKYFTWHRRNQDILKDYVFAPRLSNAEEIERIPSICRNCAEYLLDDITTTRMGMYKCKGNCHDLKAKSIAHTHKNSQSWNR